MEPKLGIADFTYFMSRSRGMVTDEDLLQKAAQWGLRCVQVGLGKPEDMDRRRALRQQAEALSLEIMGGGGGPASAEALEREMWSAKELGARVFRHACGPFRLRRQPLPPARLAEALRSVAKQAESEDVTIAIENHQDYTAAELAWIMRAVDSSHVGVCLDTGNSIALLEDPIYTAETLAPFTRAVHLKEYLVLPAAHGVDLVGTPIGTGVVDNRAIMGILRAKAPAPSLCVTIENPLERCAVPILLPEFVSEFATRPLRALGSVAALMEESLQRRPDPVLLPQEREASAEEIAAAEDDCNRRAVEYCRSVLGL